MCLAADAQGKNSDVISQHDAEMSHDRNSMSRDRNIVSHARTSVSRDRDSESQDSQERVFSPQVSRAQGLSFRVLQWLTDTADDDDDKEVLESRSCTPISLLMLAQNTPSKFWAMGSSWFFELSNIFVLTPLYT